jgi:hypothetical protein
MFTSTNPVDPKFPGDSKRQKKGQCEYGGSSSNSHLGHDFLSLGIFPDKRYWPMLFPDKRYWPMLPGTSQGKNKIDPERKQIDGTIWL